MNTPGFRDFLTHTNTLDHVTNVSIDSETQNSNHDISCLHCIEIIRKKHHEQIVSGNFETDLLKNNPLIWKFGKNKYIDLEKQCGLNVLYVKKVIFVFH